MNLADEFWAYTKGVHQARWAYETDPLALSRELARRDLYSATSSGRTKDAESIREDLAEWPAPLLLVE